MIRRLFVAILFFMCPIADLLAEQPSDSPPSQRELPDWAEERELIPTGNFTLEFVKMLSLLAALLAVLFLVTWAVRALFSHRIIRENETSEIKVIERRMIGAKAAIYLLEAEGRQFLIGESAQGISLLGRWKREERGGFEE